MNLSPLLEASFAIQLHVATVVPAFIIGTWQIFFSAKGSPRHRMAGYTYLILMTVTSISSLFIKTIMPADGPFFGFSPIHLLVPVTLAGVVGALYYARRGDIARHKRAMISTYVGAILIAGAFTFMPGRIMHAIFFG
jgi:uncharacterized membrane protein